MHFVFAGICARPAEVESEHAYIKCPICGFDTVASGQTEFDTASDNDDEPRPVLTFFPDELHCDDCGLEIDDFFGWT